MGKLYTHKTCGWTGERLPIENGQQVCGQCGAPFDVKDFMVEVLIGRDKIPMDTPATLKAEYSPTGQAIEGKVVGCIQSGLYQFEYQDGMLEVTYPQIDLLTPNQPAEYVAVEDLENAQKPAKEPKSKRESK